MQSLNKFFFSSCILLLLGGWQVVFAQNNAPACDPPLTLSVEEGTSLTFSVNASDVDGDNVTLTASGTPVATLGALFGMTATGSTSTGLFAWVPPTGSNGTYTLTITATDDNSVPLSCTQTITITVTAPTAILETICLVDGFAPGAYAIWLSGLPGAASTSYDFEGLGGVFNAFSDGTATLTGTIVNQAVANWRWEVDIHLHNKMDFASWSALGRTYKGSSLEALANHANWSYYEMDSTTSRLIGLDNFAGDTLFLSHAPTNFLYGFQFGVGANDKNGVLGVSGWFNFKGAYTGKGDANTQNFCRGMIPTITAKVMLEGAFDASTQYMKSLLSQNNVLPLSQPYNNSSYNYQGTESVTAIPGTDIVDWVLIELRDAFNPSTVIYQRAAFLRKDMYVVDLDGSPLVDVAPPVATPYYISICHRNHLDIMSSQPINPIKGEMYLYDFTSSGDQAYTNPDLPSQPLTKLNNVGPWAMVAGDATGNWVINPQDIKAVGLKLNQTGLFSSDIDLNGTTTQLDAQLIKNNYFKVSHILQLVRIHACHAWGREFESRPDRQQRRVRSLFLVKALNQFLELVR